MKMAKNGIKTAQKGNIIVYTEDYFTWVHYDNRQGITTDSDYLIFDKQQLICFFGKTKIQSLNNINMNIVNNNYGKLNKEDIEYLFNFVRYIIINDNLFELYRDIKEYILLDCIPENRFYSSIQWKNKL
jgi:hypothetical protein